ncbi:CoA-transferase family III domain-containing protein [Aspergillus leporis]|jgi:crotonobetainyl-CoA:carnitine CoA-transferase CaiB-like acyl-CoA transferase|uniref:CoA-transferase family III domain-containing protein n=1 Tax=Aspergillus leporis TaxID=41062 RepID=A0A5N5X9Y5_9EURO|nr:CoA-transferase family III domain-containing protein [Aspergillus leporis]
MASVRSLSQTLCRRIPGTRSASTLTSQKGPLSGVTVVSLEQAIAAPFCTRQLADLGARVIKVERPGVGDFARNYDSRVNGLASHFVWTNRSKESLALDLKQPRDHRILMCLLSKADVLVQNLAPGASTRLGLSHEDLKTKHPSLIVCNISGYGPDGPYRDKKAYDLLIQSEAGMLSVTGTGKEPAKVGISIADIAAGSYAYSNILAALIQRGKDPEKRGCNIDISMLESMVEWMGFPMYYTYQDALGPTPAGASHAAIYPYGPFEAGDGKSVMLGVQNEREWVKFCGTVLGLPELATDKRFVSNSLRTQNRDALKGIICGVFSSLTAEEVVALLDGAAIANASVNDMQGVWEHPQLKARGRWTEVSTPVGRVPALLPPGLTQGDPEKFSARMEAVPDVGEHNAKIFAELGIDDTEPSSS